MGLLGSRDGLGGEVGDRFLPGLVAWNDGAQQIEIAEVILFHVLSRARNRLAFLAGLDCIKDEAANGGNLGVRGAQVLMLAVNQRPHAFYHAAILDGETGIEAAVDLAGPLLLAVDQVVVGAILELVSV